MSRPKKNEFSNETKAILERRAGFKCSNPECNALTVGPAKNPENYKNVGEAAHIFSASPNGPRYNPLLTSKQISSLNNGIWVCSICHKKIDSLSDVDYYTPDLLREWKMQREEQADKELGIPQKNNREEIADISNANMEKIDRNVKFEEDVKYKDFNFPSIEKYLINYLSDDKNHTIKVQIDLYMEKILDWFVGKRKFPQKAIEKLYENFDNSMLKIDKSILSIRREALINYYTGNLLNAKKIYDDNLKNIINGKELPNWYKNDYLVDGRNLTSFINPFNRWPENNEYQKIMNDRDIYVTYPVIDRLEKTLLNKTLDGTFNIEFKRRGTQIFGFGVEEVFLNIQRIIYVSILCGSITQLNIVRNVIARVFIEYAKSFDDEEMFLKALKFYALIGKYKEYRNVLNKISAKFRKTESVEFVKEILKLRNSINPYTKNEFDIFVFNQFGRLLDDKDFLKYENRILKLLKAKRKIFIIDAMKSLYSNLERFNNKEELFRILLNLSKKGYSREVQNVLIYINYEELNQLNRDNVKKIIKIILNNKEYLLIIDLLVEIKNIEKINDYDNILLKENSKENLTYQILTNEEYNVKELEIIIDNLECKYKNIFETGVISRGAMEYFIPSKYFDKKSKRMSLLINNKIIPLAEKSLSHKNIEYREKIKMLKSLLYIHFYNLNYDKIIKKIISNVCITADGDWFEEEYDKKYLEIYLNAIRFVVGEISLNELLKSYILISDEKYFIEDISYLINYLFEKTSFSKDSLLFIDILIEKSLNSEISEYIASGVKLSKVLYKTEYFKEIYNKLIRISVDCNYEVANAFVTLLLNLKDDILNPIKKNLLRSSNYNVRFLVKRYLEM